MATESWRSGQRWPQPTGNMGIFQYNRRRWQQHSMLDSASKHGDAELTPTDCNTVAASSDNDVDEHILGTINLEIGHATATAYEVAYASQAWEHRPNSQ